jgi:hypothetical protein
MLHAATGVGPLLSLIALHSLGVATARPGPRSTSPGIRTERLGWFTSGFGRE